MAQEPTAEEKAALQAHKEEMDRFIAPRVALKKRSQEIAASPQFSTLFHDPAIEAAYRPYRAAREKREFLIRAERYTYGKISETGGINAEGYIIPGHRLAPLEQRLGADIDKVYAVSEEKEAQLRPVIERKWAELGASLPKSDVDKRIDMVKLYHDEKVERSFPAAPKEAFDPKKNLEEAGKSFMLWEKWEPVDKKIFDYASATFLAGGVKAEAALELYKHLAAATLDLRPTLVGSNIEGGERHTADAIAYLQQSTELQKDATVTRELLPALSLMRAEMQTLLARPALPAPLKSLPEAGPPQRTPAAPPRQGSLAPN